MGDQADGSECETLTLDETNQESSVSCSSHVNAFQQPHICVECKSASAGDPRHHEVHFNSSDSVSHSLRAENNERPTHADFPQSQRKVEAIPSLFVHCQQQSSIPAYPNSSLPGVAVYQLQKHPTQHQFQDLDETQSSESTLTLVPSDAIVAPKKSSKYQTRKELESLPEPRGQTCFVSYKLDMAIPNHVPRGTQRRKVVITPPEIPVSITVSAPVEMEKSNKIQRKAYVKPFIQFCNEVRSAVRRANPFATNSELMRIIGREWAALPPQEKAKYRFARNTTRFHTFHLNEQPMVKGVQ